MPVVVEETSCEGVEMALECEDVSLAGGEACFVGLDGEMCLLGCFLLESFFFECTWLVEANRRCDVVWL